MSEVLKAAFIFVAPQTSAQQHYSWVKTPQVEVKMLAVSDYQQACDQIDALIEEGMVAIELCAGFGHQGVAAISEKTDGRVPVGVVRFDHHPGLSYNTGDNLFR